ncbi:tRNA (adenosine(37)-N6)-threonylcarbamoyltransferase complex dimerization subunit type 1 TsaB [Limnohabitans sp. MMS-10A-160]|uniref:tRNA (adenosine(37)-N6)-threonylcarbamoyltransferase complex dimerization subunit type 1 TsaB n=1 Tax=unclassified Limnohabitans TaxID=2626134 RepID=UPI000DD27F95|nr:MULTISPECIES: tRNA (adenosine(37)-N6)-threonylcarbamoyltransferase complex dimerization subunit type 1 TsaB [unclassified Limnohabitans]PUE20738.1 tRNA (adenosine(37)-N6)-threonylcarbamoyltransferase complex dimerization subunit type 1 TsaB [Limnohabitans sp. MMS-10A-192]PUE24876.1 tRNA (adenosine(37)-N6)-threonylcarbamoyltransferase complex dimerization subunit type 1 TsaB [Limnohabitans sp. MMS-10A-160]
MSPTTPELRWLAFDTSTDVLSLAVARGDRVWIQTLPGGAQSSSGLIPAVLSMLAEADMPLASVTAIVFGRGPGSFTGLRTACAVAQGLAFGADVPVLPVDTLLAVAEEARWQRVQGGAADADLSVLALLDARMDEVYSAAYQWSAAGQSWQGVSALQVSAPENVQSSASVLAGNVFEAYGPRLNMPGERCVALPTAAALLRLAPALWAQGLAVPAEQAMPLYIRDKVANTTAEREAMKAQAAAAKAASNP